MRAGLRIGIKMGTTAALILVAFVFCVVLPFRKVLIVREVLRGKTDQLMQDTALLQEHKNPDEEWMQWEERFKNLGQRFPDEVSISSALQHLGDKSKDLGLEISSANPVVEERPQGPALSQPSKYERKKIVLELECSYEALGEYLACVAMLPTFFTVEELNITSQRKDPPLLNVRLVLAFYVARQGRG